MPLTSNSGQRLCARGRVQAPDPHKHYLRLKVPKSYHCSLFSSNLIFVFVLHFCLLILTNLSFWKFGFQFSSDRDPRRLILHKTVEFPWVDRLVYLLFLKEVSYFWIWKYQYSIHLRFNSKIESANFFSKNCILNLITLKRISGLCILLWIELKLNLYCFNFICYWFLETT